MRVYNVALSFPIYSRSEEAARVQEQQPHDDKTIERENRRNGQQVYTSSPLKSNEKLQEVAAGEAVANRKTCSLFMVAIVCSHIRDNAVCDV